MSLVCAGCFYRLRQLRRIRWSLDSDSLTTIVYAVVNSRCCNTVLAGAPRTVIDKLQRVLNAAARVITGTQKFDRGLGQILYDELHSLDVPDRVIFKPAVTVHRCLNGRAPPYLMDYCIPVSGANTGRSLRSANRHILAVRRFPLNTYTVYTAAGSFQLSVLRSETISRISSGTQRSIQTVSDVFAKRIFVRSILVRPLWVFMVALCNRADHYIFAL